ncbi:MAG: hypothetical protein ACM3TR_06145 [Caulobacteraceae bacterium]
MKPIKTIGKLHFEDLDPSRYEDLSLAMVYRLSRWIDIHHFGRKGNDDGIDIYAVEELENGAKRTWFIQCKRYSSISKGDLKEVVDKVISQNETIPDIFLLVASCDVTKRNIEFFMKYANDKGIANPKLWTASIIETKLYAEHHDLLFSYFGINLSGERSDRIATVRRNIKLKHRMMGDFLKKNINPRETIKRPYSKFEYSKAIIHSIDDIFYPDSDPNSVGISSWFKVELYNFYHNGIEVIIGIEEFIMDKDGYWDLVEYRDTKRKEKYPAKHTYVVGRIPYDNIIEYDLSGDNYYGCPHIYCDFKNNGMPYEDIVYYAVSNEKDQGYTFDWPLDKGLRKELEK